MTIDPQPAAHGQPALPLADPSPVHRPFRDLRRLDEWRDQVVADTGLSHLATRVAVVLSHHVSRRHGYAYPSHDRLMDLLGCGRTALRAAIAQLRDRGHLSVQVLHGRGNANRYFPVIQPRSR